jgi:hypothetical protein
MHPDATAGHKYKMNNFLIILPVAFLAYLGGIIFSHYVMYRRGNGDDFLVMLSFLCWPVAILWSFCIPSRPLESESERNHEILASSPR